MPMRIYPDSDLFKSLDRNKDWIAEVKKNGWRCLVEKKEGKVTLWTRKKTIITDAFPELRKELTDMLPDNSLFDGELIDHRTKNIKGVWYAFDIIQQEGVTVENLPFIQRRRILEQYVHTTSNILLAEQTEVGKRNLYEQSIHSEENEGIVLKKLDSKYSASLIKCNETPFWLKVKRPEAHFLKK
jgi:bifunctional non-homologous end joining protein LigD